MLWQQAGFMHMPKSNPKPAAQLSSADALSEFTKGLKTHVSAPNIYAYSPHEKQIRFHQSTAKIRCYIGGNRSGKTTGGVIEDIWRLQGNHPYQRVPPPPIRGRYIAVDFLDGVDGVALPQFSRWTPLSWLRGNSWYTAYDSYDRILYFENGSELKFMSYEQDVEKFSGTSQHFVHCDEEPPQPIYKENIARLVDTGGPISITMTPLDGMNWLFDEIYEPGILKQSPYIEIIEVDITDNPYISEGEIQIFISTLDEDEKAARIHGKYVTRGGLIYKGFNPGMHILQEGDFDWRDGNYLIAASMDHGFNNPTCFGYFAVDSDERVVQFYEHYVAGRTIDYHAKRHLEICEQLEIKPDYVVGDPSIRNSQPNTGTSISQEYAQHGVHILYGNNEVKDGIVRVARFLAKRRDNRPGFYITSNCKNTIREFGKYRWKTYQSKKTQHDNNKLEIPQKKDDHAMDMIRYFIMSRPDLTPGILAQPQPRQNPLGLATVAGNIDESLERAIREAREYGVAYSPREYIQPEPLLSGSTSWSISSDNIEGDW